jgi:hypothetical protein
MRPVAGVGMSRTRATHSDFGITDRIVSTFSKFMLSTNDITGLMEAKYSDDDDDNDNDDNDDDDDDDESERCFASSSAVEQLMFSQHCR